MTKKIAMVLCVTLLTACTPKRSMVETSGAISQDERIASAMASLEPTQIASPERFAECDALTDEKLQLARDFIVLNARNSAKQFGTQFKTETSNNNLYTTFPNEAGWGQGFTTGQYWIAYELSGDEELANIALSQIPSYKKRIKKKIGVNHHDMGFLYMPSCVEAYKQKGNQDAREAALMAADHLCTRYNPTGMFIQAWGDTDGAQNYRLIVDCLMNIPLLYWATEESGDASYADIAYKHYKTTAGNAVRSDGSTYHTYWFNATTGEPVEGTTAQGVADDSAWARGQAWTMYGFPLTYEYNKNDDALVFFKAISKYFLNHLPSDYVPYWDLSFTDGDNEPKDSSAAAIAVCGLLSGAKYLPDDDPDKVLFNNAARQIINSLIDNYLAKGTNGLLLHATYSKPDNLGVNEMNIWGDYYFAKAIQMLSNND